MSKKAIIWIVVLVLLIIFAALIMKGKSSNRDVKEVEISKVEPITIIETVAATGKIQPEVEVMLSSEVSGEIIELPINALVKVTKTNGITPIESSMCEMRITK